MSEDHESQSSLYQLNSQIPSNPNYKWQFAQSSGQNMNMKSDSYIQQQHRNSLTSAPNFNSKDTLNRSSTQTKEASP